MTNHLIKLVEKKLKVCDLDLALMKKITRDLNYDFATIENKLNHLNKSIRNINSNAEDKADENSDIECYRENSIEKDPTDDHNILIGKLLGITKSSDSSIDETSRRLEEVENSYIYVSIKPDGTLAEHSNWSTARSSIVSTDSLSFASGSYSSGYSTN
jgi:hypothetical protein